MSVLWQWFIGILASFIALFSFTPAMPQEEQSYVIIEQTYGDAPQVADVNNQLPRVNYKRVVVRRQSWTPPVTDHLSAETIMIMDISSGKTLWSRSPEKHWPTASITKLMSAIIFLDEYSKDDPVWERRYTLADEDEEDGTIYIYRGEVVSVEELFNISLIGSVNSATRALFHAVGMSDEEVVEKMNKKARAFGLWNTKYYDFTGLDFNNITTSKEAAWLLKEALEYDKIRESLQRESYSLTTTNGREINITSTNKLLGRRISIGDGASGTSFGIEGGKTGFISESGYNFAVSLHTTTGDAVIIVILGADSMEARFTEVIALAEWVLTNYTWK